MLLSDTMSTNSSVALINVDVQYDFLPSDGTHPDGSLAVTNGRDIIEPLRSLLSDESWNWRSVVATQVSSAFHAFPPDPKPHHHQETTAAMLMKGLSYPCSYIIRQHARCREVLSEDNDGWKRGFDRFHTLA